MKTLEKIFAEVARQNMESFDLESFKKTHSALYGVIIDSMRVSFLKGSDMIHEMNLQKRLEFKN